MNSIQIEGIPALQRQLSLLPDAAQIRVVKPAMLRAAQYLARGIRQNAPRGASGNLKRSVGVEAPRFFDPSAPVASVGFKRGRGRHAHLIEKGTRQRTTKSGANRGATPRNPFFSRAIAANLEGAINVLRIAWSSRLAIEAARIKGGLVRLDGRLVR